MRTPLSAMCLLVPLLAWSCAHSGAETDKENGTGSVTGELDAGVTVRTLDAASDARVAAPDAADAGDGGCVGTSCQVFDCPDGGAPSICGCDAPDADEDGTPDCADQCPSDRNKKAPGSCGCGASELDTDLDGTPDCLDKCSGKPDQAYVPDTSCGAGYCKSHNQASTCVNGVETQCKPGAARSSTDTTCDGIDDDCDGKVDEDFGASSTRCGKGACGRTGTLSCVNGKQVDSCSAAQPTVSDDTSCNNIDDDCDGETDEDYAVQASTCAAGACASTGMITCSDGKVVDSCSAKSPIASDDSTCNNIDDDCDGQIDEDYKSNGTQCGVGACASTGSTSCSKGKVVDSCRPSAKASDTDTSCNNVDDDCNGKVDDAFTSSPTTCGQGVCVARGALSCVNGGTQDSCTPGQAKSSTDDSFAPGNGLDDDCDGKVDEDVPPCDTSSKTYEAGSYDLSVPGNCHTIAISLWGGGGAGGQEIGFGAAGGAGGPGGFVSATALVNGAIKLSVGSGGSNGCNNGGGNPETSHYNGGSGGGGSGDDGGDGQAAGGGSGGGQNGARGGAGHFGGGGGGAGSNGIFGSSGDGGGGGAASVLTVNGVRAAVAGGGGGGGGAQGAFLNFLASRGGAGGSGCGADGRAESSTGGGGGGGGLCVGATTQTGAGTTPASSDKLPSGRARGGASSCNAGGNGYAIVTFAP